MKRWEYKIETNINISWDYIKKLLNKLGGEGWELVRFDQDGGGCITVIFKRPLPRESQKAPTISLRKTHVRTGW